MDKQMSLERKVTLEDFIMPEYRGKNPDDYEFRGDGKIVRKDRWETGIHRIHTIQDRHGIPLPLTNPDRIGDRLLRNQGAHRIMDNNHILILHRPQSRTL